MYLQVDGTHVEITTSQVEPAQLAIGEPSAITRGQPPTVGSPIPYPGRSTSKSGPLQLQASLGPPLLAAAHTATGWPPFPGINLYGCTSMYHLSLLRPSCWLHGRGGRCDDATRAALPAGDSSLPPLSLRMTLPRFPRFAMRPPRFCFHGLLFSFHRCLDRHCVQARRERGPGVYQSRLSHHTACTSVRSLFGLGIRR